MYTSLPSGSICGLLGSYKMCSKQCLAQYPLKYTLTCCHRPLLQLLEVLPPQDPTIKEASMPSALELLCTKTMTSALQLDVHLQVADGASPAYYPMHEVDAE
jgi:hypothetical protein